MISSYQLQERGKYTIEANELALLAIVSSQWNEPNSSMVTAKEEQQQNERDLEIQDQGKEKEQRVSPPILSSVSEAQLHCSTSVSSMNRPYSAGDALHSESMVVQEDTASENGFLKSSIQWVKRRFNFKRKKSQTNNCNSEVMHVGSLNVQQNIDHMTSGERSRSMSGPLGEETSPPYHLVSLCFGQSYLQTKGRLNGNFSIWMNSIRSRISSNNKNKSEETLDTLIRFLLLLFRGSCNSLKLTRSTISTYPTKTAFLLSPLLCLRSSSPLLFLLLEPNQLFLLPPIIIPQLLRPLTNGFIFSTSRALSTVLCPRETSMCSWFGTNPSETSLHPLPHLLAETRRVHHHNSRKIWPRKKTLQRFSNQLLN